MNEQEQREQMLRSVEESAQALNTVLKAMAPKVDSAPTGIPAIALVATLRAYADLLSFDFPPLLQPEVEKLKQFIIDGLKKS